RRYRRRGTALDRPVERLHERPRHLELAVLVQRNLGYELDVQVDARAQALAGRSLERRDRLGRWRYQRHDAEHHAIGAFLDGLVLRDPLCRRGKHEGKQFGRREQPYVGQREVVLHATLDVEQRGKRRTTGTWGLA